MTGGTIVTGQLEKLRSGYKPTEAEASAWNVAQSIHGLRQHVRESDLAWLMPAISEDDGPRAAFYLALLQPLAKKAGVSTVLAQRFEIAGPYLKSQLLWRLLDDAALPVAMHETLFKFVMSDWETFQSSCVAYLGTPSQILQAALTRLADCPSTKRWIYLCCLPQYADNQHAVKGLLTIATSSTETFMAHVARTLIDRCFSENR